MAGQNKVLLVGCGDIGVPLGLALAAGGAQVWGLRRRGELPDPLHVIHADVTRPESLQALREQAFDYVVITLTPAGFNDEGYRSVFVEGLQNVLAVLMPHPPKRLLFVSSTSVYHQCDGEWVDEESPTAPSTFSGRRLLEAEQLLADSDLTSTVVRFAGIYGPGRRRLIEQVRAGQGCPREPALYTNRIHREDCVGFLHHLLALDKQGEPIAERYIGVDDAPVTMWEVKHWLAEQLGVSLSDESSAVTNRRSSKRCRNQRLRDSGYVLKYPSFIDGYQELIGSG